MHSGEILNLFTDYETVGIASPEPAGADARALRTMEINSEH